MVVGLPDGRAADWTTTMGGTQHVPGVFCWVVRLYGGGLGGWDPICTRCAVVVVVVVVRWARLLRAPGGRVGVKEGTPEGPVGKLCS